jgi:multidrug efflux pump subunit AcrA (membrane-fusion protein)
MSLKASAVAVFPLLGALCLAHGAAGAGDAPQPQIHVLAAKAARRCFAVAIHATGAVVPKAVAVAAVELPNMRLDELLAKEGDPVAVGQKLARLARSPANGQRPRAETDAADAFLYAPAEGRIFKIAAAAGETVSRRPEPLIQIAIKDEFELQAQIPASQIPKLKPGQTARIDFGQGQEMVGTVRLVPKEVNRLSQLGEARIALGASRHPPPGAFARVSIDAQRRCGVSAPRSAILQQSENTSVQVIRNNIVMTRDIRLGLLSEEAAEVVEGLVQDDLIVAHAGTSLHDGDEVIPELVEMSP